MVCAALSGRPPAASRASTVAPATLFRPLLAGRTPGRDAGRDRGGKSGLVLHSGTATGEPVLVSAALQEMQVPVVAVPPVARAVLGLDLRKPTTATPAKPDHRRRKVEASPRNPALPG